MSYSTRLLVLLLVTTMPQWAQAQGRSGRERQSTGPSNVPRQVTQQTERRVNQAVQQQVQRRADQQARHSLDRRAAAAEMAARAVAQRSAREASDNPKLRRFAEARGLRPEFVAEQAKIHADVHAKIATGLRTGQPVELNDQQREQLEQVFGDADWLEARREMRSGRPERSVRSTNGNEVEQVSTEANDSSVRPLPGSRTNSRARLANAIRVRKAQISELRDRALETGDEKLMERADQLEKTLDIFLANQARVEANLAEVGARTRGEQSVASDVTDSTLTEPAVRTAEMLELESGLIDESAIGQEAPRIE